MSFPIHQIQKRSEDISGGKPKPKKNRENKRRNMSFVQYDLKWHAIRHLYDVILNSRLPGRPGTSVNLVASLCAHLQAVADANEAKTMINRDNFINALLGKYGSRMQDSKASLIFSTFDPFNVNRIHYANVIACLSILEHPTETARKKLQRLWRLYKEHRYVYRPHYGYPFSRRVALVCVEEVVLKAPHVMCISVCCVTHSKDRNVLDNVLSIMTTCCSNMGDHAVMERAVRNELIPYCYRSIALKPSAATKRQLEIMRSTAPVIKMSKRQQKQAKAAEEKAAQEAARNKGTPGEEGADKATAGRTATIPSTETDVVYNICNEVFDEDDFGEALAACSSVVVLFDEQMKTILFQQDRHTEDEAARERARAQNTHKTFEATEQSNQMEETGAFSTTMSATTWRLRGTLEVQGGGESDEFEEADDEAD